MAQLLQHSLQGCQCPVSSSISPCLASKGLWPQGCLTPSSPHSCTAAVPCLLWRLMQAPMLSTESARESNLMPYTLISQIKQQGTFVYWVPMNGAVLAVRSASRSHSGHSCWRAAHSCSRLLPQEPFGRAYPLIPGINCPTVSHHLHLPPCRGGIQFMGHCRIGSIALFTWDVQASNAKWCCLLLDFMVFPTLHSLFVHLLFQHQQTTKGNLRLH